MSSSKSKTQSKKRAGAIRRVFYLPIKTRKKGSPSGSLSLYVCASVDVLDDLVQRFVEPLGVL